MGDIGRGKSYSVRTLLKSYPDENGKLREGVGLDVYCLACEPGWSDTNGDLTCEMGFHVAEVLPANPSFDTMKKWLERIQDLDAEQIKKLGVPGSIRKDYRQFMSLYVTSIEFICIRCKKNFGCAEDWDENIAFVNDGLTGISKMAIDFTVGPKNALTWPEYDESQGKVKDWVDKCVSLKCSYILIAHWDREPDQVEGGSTITLHTIGNKLAPKL